MKTLLKLFFRFGLLLNLNAQNKEMTSMKIKGNQLSHNSFKIGQKVKIFKGLLMDLTPQFGNQFISRKEAIKSKLDLKEFYEDFDFGLNMGFDVLLKEQLQFKAIYNMGVLKFGESNIRKVNSCIVKLSIDYVF